LFDLNYFIFQDSFPSTHLLLLDQSWRFMVRND